LYSLDHEHGGVAWGMDAQIRIHLLIFWGRCSCGTLPQRSFGFAMPPPLRLPRRPRWCPRPARSQAVTPPGSHWASLGRMKMRRTRWSNILYR
jgi:hypothetical protein